MCLLSLNISPAMPLTYPSLQLKDEPEGILGRRMIKKRNEAVSQILIKWVNRDVEEASWEDYEEVRERFPAFILRDKDYFEREGVSGSIQNRLLAVENVDSVKQEEEGNNRNGPLGLVTTRSESQPGCIGNGPFGLKTNRSESQQGNNGNGPLGLMTTRSDYQPVEWVPSNGQGNYGVKSGEGLSLEVGPVNGSVNDSNEVDGR